MRIFGNKAFLVALTGFVIALSVHLINGKLSGLPWGIHTTADDASYLRPAENWLDTGTWKDNSDGASAYVQRPPLFGIIHGIFYAMFGPSAAIATLFFFLLLHALALYRLPGILQKLTDERTAFRLAWIYAVLPCFWGFLSYRITEAVSPSLVLLLLGALLSRNRFAVVWAILLITCLWFLRPVLVLLFPLLLYFLWKRRRELFARSFWWNALVGGLAVLLVFGWEYRKAGYLGKWGELHPIYHSSNQGIFRPVHASLSNVFRVWETRPEVFHGIVASCWPTDSTRRSLPAIKRYVAERNVPLEPAELHRILSDYATINRTLVPRIENGTLHTEVPEEIVFRLRLDSLTERLRDEHATQYLFKTPLRSAAEQLRKSQLNLEIFQVHYRGYWLMEGLRYLCVAVLLLLFVSGVLSLLSRRTELRWIAAGIVLYCFYLFFVQRMNEDRYLAPMLPLVFAAGCAGWYNALRALFPTRGNGEPLR